MPDLLSLMVWAATYFIHSTLLLGCVWLWFRRREPSSHAFREAVWKLAAVGGIMTATLQLGFEIQSPVNTLLSDAWNYSFARTEMRPALAVNMEHTDRTTDLANLRTGPQESLGDDLRQAESQTTMVALESAPPESVWESDSELAQSPAAVSSPGNDNIGRQDASATSPGAATWNLLLKNLLTGFAAALCGAIVALSGWGLVRLLTEQWEFRRRLSTCYAISSGDAHRMLTELLREAGVRRPVRLMLDEADLEPGACGWFNWQIVLPARALEELSPQELRGLLAHELAHLVRGDQWWLLLGRLLAVCFGWQPLNRIALREWQVASEYLCDAWAIQRSVPRLSLARCLTTVAEWRLVGLATVAGLGSGNPSNLSERVERLVDDRPLADPWQRYSRRHFLAAAGCLVAVGMVGLAPAATFPGTPRGSLVKRTDSFAPSAAHLDSPTNSMAIAESTPSAYSLELLATDDQSLPQGIVVTVEMIEVMRRQVSSDVSALVREMDAVGRDISRFPQGVAHPLWRLRIQRLEQRLQHIQRLQNALLIPL